MYTLGIKYIVTVRKPIESIQADFSKSIEAVILKFDISEKFDNSMMRTPSANSDSGTYVKNTFSHDKTSYLYIQVNLQYFVTTVTLFIHLKTT